MRHRQVIERGARYTNNNNKCIDAANLYEHVAKYGSEDGQNPSFSNFPKKRVSFQCNVNTTTNSPLTCVISYFENCKGAFQPET